MYPFQHLAHADLLEYPMYTLLHSLMQTLWYIPCRHRRRPPAPAHLKTCKQKAAWKGGSLLTWMSMRRRHLRLKESLQPCTCWLTPLCPCTFLRLRYNPCEHWTHTYPLKPMNKPCHPWAHTFS